MKVRIIGNVGKTPELKQYPNGDQYAVFSVAENNTNGAGVKTTLWYEVVLTGNRVKMVPHIKPGTRMFVEGHGKVNPYISKTTNQAAFSIQIYPTEIDFMSPKEKTETTNSDTSNSADTTHPSAPLDNIPF